MKKTFYCRTLHSSFLVWYSNSPIGKLPLRGASWIL
jgi:hypothetical protein